MCPACLTTLALIAVGTGSAGGLTAVVAKKLHDRTTAKSVHEGTTEPEQVDGKEELR